MTMNVSNEPYDPFFTYRETATSMIQVSVMSGVSLMDPAAVTYVKSFMCSDQIGFLCESTRCL